MRIVPIQCVSEESCLAKDIYDDDGRILLKSGIKLTSNIIERIKNAHIFTIYVKDKYSDKIIEDVIKPEIKNQATLKIKETFSVISEYCKKSQQELECEKEFYKRSKESFKSVEDMAIKLIEQVINRRDVMLRLVDIKSVSNYLYRHCVNVAVISLIIGIRLNFHKFQLLDLCVGALLHDIGKIFVPKDILNKKTKLTKDEFEVVKEHTRKGYQYLNERSQISLPAKVVVWQHHERVGGQGYPEGINGDRITVLSKIVAIADVYDAMVSDRNYRYALSPNDAIEYIMANAGRLFDYNIVQYFIKVVVPYPEGTIVKLSNGDVAIVEEINSNALLRPTVKILYSKNVKDINRKIKLTKELDIVIKNVEKDLKKLV